MNNDKLDTLIQLFEQMINRIESLERTVANAAMAEKSSIYGTDKSSAAFYIMDKAKAKE